MRNVIVLVCLLSAVAGCEKHSSKDRTPESPASTGNWPGFRGPTGDGKAAADAQPPLELDLRQDVLWKAPLEKAAGFSSPIVWGDRVYLTAAPNDVLAFERSTGNLLWRITLQLPPLPPQGEDEYPWEPGYAGLASPTPCTDGQRIFAFFGDGSLGCVDASGKQVWAHRLVVRPVSSYGLSASTIIHEGLVIQVVDLDLKEVGGKMEPQSFAIALRASDGQEVWRAPRPVSGSWATPLVIRRGTESALITSSNPWIIAYDPMTGRELWRCGGMKGDVVATPVADQEKVYCAADPQGAVLAIRLGGAGDVTSTHVAWTYEDEMPDTPSPLLAGDRYLHMSDSTVLVCLNTADGKEQWQVEESVQDGQEVIRALAPATGEGQAYPELWRVAGRFQTGFVASPVLAAGRIYWAGEMGRVVIFDPATGKPLQIWTLEDKFSASPAIVGNQVILRGEKQLWCIARR